MEGLEQYSILISYSTEYECYSARIPDLPGCIADGETISEAIVNVRSLARDWISLTEEASESIQKPSTNLYKQKGVIAANDCEFCES